MYEQYFSEKLKNKLKEQRQRAADNPNDANVLTQAGAFLFTVEYYGEEARSYLEKAVKIDPINIDARFWLAKSLYHDACDYEEAKELLYETVKLAPTRADCLSLLAYVLLDLDGVTEEAFNYLREAIRFSPDWTLPRRELIHLYISIGEFELAEREMKKLASIIENMGKEDVKISNDIEDYYERCVTGRFTIARNIQALKEQEDRLNKFRMAS